mgnify:CR=1 FL=1
MDLIVSDLDNSILYNNRISLDDIRSIKEWYIQGNIFTIATGRPLQRVEKILEQLDIVFPVILLNGALVYEKDFGIKTIKHIGEKRVLEFFDLLLAFCALKNCVLYYPDEIVLLNPDKQLQDKMHEWELDYICVESLQKVVAKDLIMITIYSPDYELQKNIDFIATKFNIGSCNEKYIDIIPDNINKGVALEHVLKQHQFNEIYIIGDSFSDVSMKSENNFFAVVENANEDIKAEADIFIPSFKENPVSSLINMIRRIDNESI